MAIMKTYIVALMLMVSLLCAQQNDHEVIKDLKLLQSIDSNAIIMGEGVVDVYVFIDPLCPFSRKFISMVWDNKAMLHKYRYHLFLYEIPRLHSKDAIEYIYEQQDKLPSLLKIMIKNSIEYKKQSSVHKPDDLLKQISDTAQSLHVNKRPFILISQEGL